MLRAVARLFALVSILSLGVLFLPRVYTTIRTSSALTNLEDAEHAQIAIVFGAALTRTGRPSAVLRDRIITAVRLYQAGKVDMVLMSGQDPEPAAMRDYALDLGVPPDAVLLDDAGLRTYDTCYRASSGFQVSEAILVTQAFHQARALYTCRQFGMTVAGVPAQQSRYYRGALTLWNLREFMATFAALWDLHIDPPQVTLKNADPISHVEANP